LVNEIIFCLVDIPRDERSKLDSMFTLIVAEYSDMKENEENVEKAMQPLLDDLIQLEKGVDGIKAGIVAYCGDNLELNDFGEFQKNFNCGFFCRFCQIPYSALKDTDGYLQHRRWDKEIYDEIGAAVETETIGGGACGLRGICKFNKLETFHATTSLAPDLMHDFLEGVVAYDLAAGLKCLKQDSWFSVEQYNTNLSKFKLFFYENRDRPSLLKANLKQERIKGKAMSILIHLRKTQ
jgi:hypothetical protein